MSLFVRNILLFSYSFICCTLYCNVFFCVVVAVLFWVFFPKKIKKKCIQTFLGTFYCYFYFFLAALRCLPLSLHIRSHLCGLFPLLRFRYFFCQNLFFFLFFLIAKNSSKLHHEKQMQPNLHIRLITPIIAIFLFKKKQDKKKQKNLTQ